MLANDVKVDGLEALAIGILEYIESSSSEELSEEEYLTTTPIGVGSRVIGSVALVRNSTECQCAYFIALINKNAGSYEIDKLKVRLPSSDEYDVHELETVPRDIRHRSLPSLGGGLTLNYRIGLRHIVLIKSDYVHGFSPFLYNLDSIDSLRTEVADVLSINTENTNGSLDIFDKGASVQNTHRFPYDGIKPVERREGWDGTLPALYEVKTESVEEGGSGFLVNSLSSEGSPVIYGLGVPEFSSGEASSYFITTLMIRDWLIKEVGFTNEYPIKWVSYSDQQLPPDPYLTSICVNKKDVSDVSKDEVTYSDSHCEVSPEKPKKGQYVKKSVAICAHDAYKYRDVKVVNPDLNDCMDDQQRYLSGAVENNYVWMKYHNAMRADDLLNTKALKSMAGVDIDDEKSCFDINGHSSCGILYKYENKIGIKEFSSDRDMDDGFDFSYSPLKNHYFVLHKISALPDFNDRKAEELWSRQKNAIIASGVAFGLALIGVVSYIVYRWYGVPYFIYKPVSKIPLL